MRVQQKILIKLAKLGILPNADAHDTKTQKALSQYIVSIYNTNLKHSKLEHIQLNVQVAQTTKSSDGAIVTLNPETIHGITKGQSNYEGVRDRLEKLLKARGHGVITFQADRKRYKGLRLKTPAPVQVPQWVIAHCIGIVKTSGMPIPKEGGALSFSPALFKINING